MSEMETLSLESLPQYDGGSLSILVNQEFRRAYLDLVDRPLLKKGRTITLKFALQPSEVDVMTGGPPVLISVSSEVSVQCNLPNKECRVQTIAPNASKGLVFHPDRTVTTRRDHPDQQHLFEGDRPDAE